VDIKKAQEMRAMTTTWRRVYDIIIDCRQNQVLRIRLLRSVLVSCFMLLVMTLYQITKTLYAENMTVRQSQAVTIIFTSIVAGIAAYFVLRRQEGLLAQVAHERALIETVTQNVGAGLAIISRDYRTIWANQALKDFYGKVEGKVCYVTYNQQEAVCPACGVREIFENGKDRVVHEQAGKDLTGQLIWSQIVATPIKNNQGEIVSALELVLPITDQKLAREAIEASHNRLLTVLESMNAIVYVADLGNHELLYLNRYAREIFGDATGKVCWQALQTDQQGPCSFCTNDHLLTPDGKPAGVYAWEFQNTINGRWYLIYDQAIQWTDGRLVRLEIASDMTAQKQLEQQLREQAKILDEIHDAVVAADADGYVTQWSRGAEKLYGYSAQEAIGQHVSFVHPPAVRDTLVPKIIDTLKSEGRCDLEREALKKSGDTSFVHTSFSVLKDRAGAITGMVAYTIDISERKRYEQELADLRDFYHSVLENIVDGVCVTDEDGKVRFANSGLGNILAIDPKEILGKALFDEVLNDRLQGSLHPSYLEAKISGKPIAYSFIPLPLDKGTTIYLSGWIVPRMMEGNHRGMIFTAFDVTGQKQAEDKIRRSEEKFRNVFQLSPIGIELYDGNGRLVDVNQACLDLFGVVDRQQVLGFDLFADPNLPDDRKAKLIAGEVVRYEKEFDFDLVKNRGLYPTTRTGTLFIDVTLSALSQGSSVPTGFLVQVRDVSARKRVEEEMVKLKKLEATSILAGGIAHDFNNLLSVILGSINIVRMDLPPGHPPAILDMAENAALRAKELTDKFVIFASEGTPMKRVMDPGKLVEDSAELALSGSNVSWMSSLPANLWPVAIDPGQIRQAITNVIVNAREAMPAGGKVLILAENVTISGTEEELSAVLRENCYVKISIQDPGKGIPDNLIDKVFDPYFSTKDRGSDKGMGFGLALTHATVIRHGGHIVVKSEAGKGTTVDIYLPASSRTPHAPDLHAPETIRAPGRILVLEDDEMMLECTKMLGQRIGYEIVGTKNGEEAIQTYLEAYQQHKPFDLVILDLTVRGGMGGKEAISILRKIDPTMKAVISSGYSQDPVMSQFADHGFDGALAKPYTMKQLEEILRQVLES
jgi:two-component system, cell cycle sensor histidine kinase and response regulator CckA